MKHRAWAALAVLFFVEMCLGGLLMDRWLLPRTVTGPMVWSGLIGFFVACVGLIRHPAHVCPNCGRGVVVNRRTVRIDRSGRFRCPHCGAMLHSRDLKKAE
nr:hypothetical protein [uncultured Oscillibacter sp.]